MLLRYAVQALTKWFCDLKYKTWRLWKSTTATREGQTLATSETEVATNSASQYRATSNDANAPLVLRYVYPIAIRQGFVEKEAQAWTLKAAVS